MVRVSKPKHRPATPGPPPPGIAAPPHPYHNQNDHRIHATQNSVYTHPRPLLQFIRPLKEQTLRLDLHTVVINLNQVWFEDPRAVQAKSQFAFQSGFGGVAYWRGNAVYGEERTLLIHTAAGALQFSFVFVCVFGLHWCGQHRLSMTPPS